jgi:uncharacterized protein (TIGR02001 family)
VALSATLASDYRYRGVSLSDGMPALSVTAAYDHPSGAYLSVEGVAADTAHDGVRALGYQAYAGYARRFGEGASWDVGVTHYDLTGYFQPRYRARYSEVYVGVAWPVISAHLYYSPDYLGEGEDTLYGSLDAALSRGTGWRLFGHAGLLAPVRTKASSEIRSPQLDLRAGVARRVAGFELQLAGTAVGPDAAYPANHRQSHEALVVSLTRSF